MAYNVKVRKENDYKINTQTLPVETATVISKGDLVSYESGYAVLVDAAADDATFVGVSMSATKAGEVEPIVIQMQCIAEATVDSAAYTYGQSLTIGTGTGALADGGANTIAWSVIDTASVDVTSLKILVDVTKLGKIFPVNA